MLQLFRRLRARLRYRHFGDELAREIESHRQMAQAELEASGLAPADAKDQATRALGNVTLAREQARDVWLAPWIDSVGQDLRYALRTLRRSPSFAAMATAALVLAMGLNTSLFSVFNAIVLQPWPIPDPERAFVVFPQHGGGPVNGVSPVEYRLLRDQGHSGRLVGFFSPHRVQLGDDSTTAAVPARLVSANYFDVLGLGLALGRGFHPDEDRVGDPKPVVVLGSDAWRQRFNADPGVLGRSVAINEVTFTVIGIAAPNATDSPLDNGIPWVWMPMASYPLLNSENRFAQAFLTEPGNCCITLAGRLAPGVDRATVAAELTTLDHQFRLSQHDRAQSRMLVTDTTLGAQPNAARVVPIFALFFSGVLLLLLLACANVGNLQLARALSRRREIGIRVSLGASRLRVIRQLITEGLVLALGAGALSVYVGYALPPLILAQLPGGDDASALALAPDLKVLAFTALTSLVACLVASLAPALRGTRRAAEAVRPGQHEPEAGRLPLRTALLATQVAISTVLLVAAGLLVRGVWHAATFDPGFRSADVVVASIQWPRGAYPQDTSRVLLLNVQDALARATAGTVGATSVVPLSHVSASANVRLLSEPSSAARPVDVQSVSPGYFDVVDLKLVAGRRFTRGDGDDVVVVNETMARTLWPAGDAIGRSLVLGARTCQVLGVVRDAHLTSLDQVPPTLFQQDRGASTQLVLRSTSGISAQVRAVVASLDSRAFVSVQPLSDNLREFLRASFVGATLAASLGLAGLTLAAIGIFGVFSYIVTERSREIGIRLAIGARASDVIRLVLGRTAWSLGTGLGVGLAVSLAVSPVLRHLIYGVSPHDPLALGTAAITLTVAALVATVVPVRRALRVDPSVTLRQD